MPAIQTVVAETSVAKVVDGGWNIKADSLSSSGGDNLTTVYVAVGVVAAVVALGRLGRMYFRQRNRNSKASEEKQQQQQQQQAAVATAAAYNGAETGGAGIAESAAAAASDNRVNLATNRPAVHVTKHAEVEARLAGFK
jgi:hypothetical protein